MGTSVQMLMSNYAQIPENEDEEYRGLGDVSEEEEEEEEPRPKKRAKKAQK